MSIDFSHIRYFQPYEFERPECLRWEMVEKLDRLREACGFPFVITSSYRDPEHNAQMGGVPESSHCLAPDGFYSGIDIATSNFGGAGLYKFITNALWLGYNRIGVYKHHVHLDVEDRLPQQVMWIGDD